ncbi:NAD(P)/FAD-dependent oxidoreductase [Candidatus Woesearchaeota archaeon]|nr:NAD(P)/FAD-dependent oxidoreductase [Candidatus Woesearchaeota archaeon]
MVKKAVIIGAGPAGLTAAYELLDKTNIKPIIIEKSDYIGGISRTANYKGNRIDIGGHRFFSKSDKVMQWWLNILPLEKSSGEMQNISYQGQNNKIKNENEGRDPKKTDKVMLIRRRKSRIYFLRKFFDYPITLSKNTLINLGLIRSILCGISYTKSMIKPIKPEKNLEEFFINRFGKRLYKTFFKSYTEKVWGVKCNDINAEWGAQRIKGLSISKAIKHFLFNRNKKDINQKNVETSLIEQFLYPKFGPGQMWEEVAKIIIKKGGIIINESEVNSITIKDNKISKIEAINKKTNKKEIIEGDYFFSTMPVKDLISSINTDVPENIKNISNGLMYRDFITVGMLLKKLKIKDEKDKTKLIKDNWIYIQEPEVLLGRLQVFNNWSPYLVSDHEKVWIGLEYFCYTTDELWKKSEKEMIEFAKQELIKIGIIEKSDFIDATVIKMEKTYPAYFGTYDQFDKIREYLDKFENLFLIGRNGMHKYNNQDHSMLTAMTAVENIIKNKKSKENIWGVNTEQEYHERK